MSICELLVPVDGSARSLAALDVAAGFGRRLRVPVDVVMVRPPTEDCAPALAWLDSHIVDQDIGATVVIDRAVAPAILEVAGERPGCVLCFSARGHTRFGPPLGSVAAALVRDSAAPVLVVGPQVAAPPAVTVVDICVHGDPRGLVGPAGEWSTRLGVRPRLVAVQPPDEVLLEETPTDWELERVRTGLLDAGLDPQVSVLHGHDPVAEVVTHATAGGAAIIVASRDLHRGRGRILLPGFTDRLLQTAVCPVLLVPSLH